MSTTQLQQINAPSSRFGFNGELPVFGFSYLAPPSSSYSAFGQKHCSSWKDKTVNEGSYDERVTVSENSAGLFELLFDPQHMNWSFWISVVPSQVSECNVIVP